MLAGIRIKDLRKVYTSPPPLAAGAGAFGFGGARAKGKQPKPQIVALDGISLDITPGEIFCLLGPNGAGKSTTVGILTTRVRPTSGQAWIGEHEVWKEQVAVKRSIGVVAQRPNLDFSLTAREILTFHGAYFGQHAHEREKRAQALLDRFKLLDRADQIVRGFSGGMMQRLSIARAMMHDPQVLFLDEPSVGLDPQTRLLLWEIVREYNQSGKTILLTTHNMEEADALCQRLAIVDHGRIIALGTPQELKASVPGGYLLRLRFGHAVPELVQRLQSLAGVREVRATDGNGVDIYADRGGSLVPEVANAALTASVELCDVHISEPSLENLFLAPYREEPARMNLKTFLAMLARDAHVARRNIIPLLLQTFLQPLMFVFIFGRVMVGSGYMPPAYKSLLLPGIMALSMVGTGIWAVAMPLIAEFQFTREIEDRLLAPMEISWLAVEKVVAGTLQALAAGIMVIPCAWLLLRPGVDLSLRAPFLFVVVALLVALFSAVGGLALGCSVEQTHIGLMFSLVVAPMIFFGCTYYPWSALQNFPIMQKIVLVNPLVYASEGLRLALVPQFPHLPLLAVLAGLLFFNVLLLTLGLRQFHKKAIT